MEREMNPVNEDPSDFIIDVSGAAEIPIPYKAAQEKDTVMPFQSAGEKFRKKLGLDGKQTELVNKLSFSTNVFNEIDYCRIQIIRQFLRTAEYLERNCIPVNKTYPTVIDEVSEIIIVLEYNYRKDSLNYQYTIDSIRSEIFNHILKLCENSVRDYYGIKRKINTDFKYTHPEITGRFHKKIILPVESFLSRHRHLILDADYRTNLILNETHTNRWKDKFAIITSDYTNAIAFEREIGRLAEVNVKNPSLDDIYLEASKFISAHDRNAALRLYLHYLDKDLQSKRSDRKHLTRSIRKNLFSTPEQLAEFEGIVNEFVLTRDLATATKKLDTVYLPKRKKIMIDRNAIDLVQQLDSQTSQILGDLLADEEEPTGSPELYATENTADIQFEVVDTGDAAGIQKYLPEPGLNDAQTDLLTYFEKNSLTVLKSDLEDYMRSRQLFMNAAIESVNDRLYDMLDDVLIEEEDDYLTINPEYYKKLLNNDQ
ncbi:tellurite resistance TerB C-terminal domain-containing protein [Chryseobacterium hagamense]|uniref:TerB-C domain-containing protein n=1 Tax=Chryseobacterium hagamense TaxID=395935 RepID=A0A511YGL2_9FLAO|nr:tellurite resistance TerB C-terminal domain-containing protein [Chryseobacterium hagamense]GEN74313.1 hypothetical protein CHA01nite_00530 [Chryseobacterium hagamense]